MIPVYVLLEIKGPVGTSALTFHNTAWIIFQSGNGVRRVSTRHLSCSSLELEFVRERGAEAAVAC